MRVHCGNGCLRRGVLEHNRGQRPLLSGLVATLRLQSWLLLSVWALCCPVTRLMAGVALVGGAHGPGGRWVPDAGLSCSGLVPLVWSSWLLLLDGIPLIEGARPTGVGYY